MHIIIVMPIGIYESFTEKVIIIIYRDTHLVELGNYCYLYIYITYKYNYGGLYSQLPTTVNREF